MSIMGIRGITGKVMLAVCSTSVSTTDGCTHLGSDVKPLSLSPSPHVKLEQYVREPIY